MTLHRILLTGTLPVLLAGQVSAASLTPFLFSDQTNDAVYLVTDTNMDGDGNDPGETEVFFNGSNLSGLVDPTGNIFTMHQARNRAVFIGDGDTDSVYRIRDTNADGDAQDAGEASLWFSSANAEGQPLQTPNGLAEGDDGAIYIVQADTVGTPTQDVIYRTVDINNDGDANDLGESEVWVDLSALNPSSSPFEIIFIDDTAFVTDTAGGDPVIYRIQDANDDGSIDPGTEIDTFIDNTNPFGQNVFSFALAALGDSVLIVDLFTDEIVALTDENGSGTIDQANEILSLWDTTVFPLPPYEFGSNFSLASTPGGELLFTSNGSEDFEDLILRLVDLNADGTFFDPGETLFPLARVDNGSLPVRPRTVIAYAPVPLPGGLPMLLGAVLSGVALRQWRKA